LTEAQKDSQMKITEPKTPYVRYNAETDEIEGGKPRTSQSFSSNLIVTSSYRSRYPLFGSRREEFRRELPRPPISRQHRTTASFSAYLSPQVLVL